MDPMLRQAGVNRSTTVFRFKNFGDHRFTGATDCLYNPRFRSRYHAARASRLLHWSTVAGAERPKDELWLSVHYRAGDVEHTTEYVAKGRGDLAALAYYVRAAVRYLASDAERLHGRATGLRPVVHFFSEGKAHAFKRFTDVLPDAVLHLGNNGGDTTKHDIDLMTQSHVLIGGFSTFFQMAAHLCDACVVLSTDVAKDASRMDGYLPHGRHWPRANEFVKLHHGSAGEERFDGEMFGRALAKVLAAPAPWHVRPALAAPAEKKSLPCGPNSARASCAEENALTPAEEEVAPEAAVKAAAPQAAEKEGVVAKPKRAKPSPSPSPEDKNELPCGAHSSRASCATPTRPPAAPPPPSLS